MREQLEGICEHCGKVFTYYLVHCGFSDSSYAYCDTCGSTALLSLWSPTYPVNVGTLPKGDPFQEISAEWEQYLRPCGCGGRFKKGATPRCPNCNRQLSPDSQPITSKRTPPAQRKVGSGSGVGARCTASSSPTSWSKTTSYHRSCCEITLPIVTLARRLFPFGNFR